MITLINTERSPLTRLDRLALLLARHLDPVHEHLPASSLTQRHKIIASLNPTKSPQAGGAAKQLEIRLSTCSSCSTADDNPSAAEGRKQVTLAPHVQAVYKIKNTNINAVTKVCGFSRVWCSTTVLLALLDGVCRNLSYEQ